MDEEWDPNALVVCPFDNAHVVCLSRFQRHILKCRKVEDADIHNTLFYNERKNYLSFAVNCCILRRAHIGTTLPLLLNHPGKDTVTCPYNATHIILRVNLRNHLGSCPDQRAIDPDIIQAQNEETGEVEKLMGKVSLPERTWVPPAESEDWDLEASQHQKEKRISNDSLKAIISKVETSPKIQSKVGMHDSAKLFNRSEDNTNDLGCSPYVRMAGRGFNLHVREVEIPKQRVGRGPFITNQRWQQ